MERLNSDLIAYIGTKMSFKDRNKCRESHRMFADIHSDLKHTLKVNTANAHDFHTKCRVVQKLQSRLQEITVVIYDNALVEDVNAGLQVFSTQTCSLDFMEECSVATLLHWLGQPLSSVDQIDMRVMLHDVESPWLPLLKEAMARHSTVNFLTYVHPNVVQKLYGDAPWSNHSLIVKVPGKDDLNDYVVDVPSQFNSFALYLDDFSTTVRQPSKVRRVCMNNYNTHLFNSDKTIHNIELFTSWFNENTLSVNCLTNIEMYQTTWGNYGAGETLAEHVLQTLHAVKSQCVVYINVFNNTELIYILDKYPAVDVRLVCSTDNHLIYCLLCNYFLQKPRPIEPIEYHYTFNAEIMDLKNRPLELYARLTKPQMKVQWHWVPLLANKAPCI